MYQHILCALMAERSVHYCDVYRAGRLRGEETGECENAMRLGFHRVRCVGALKCLCSLDMNRASQLRVVLLLYRHVITTHQVFHIDFHNDGWE